MIVPSEILTKALSAIAPAARQGAWETDPKKGLQLDGALLESGPEGLAAHASSASAYISCHVLDYPGTLAPERMLVPWREAYDLFRAYPAGDVHLEVPAEEDGEEVAFGPREIATHCGKLRATIKGWSPDQFPREPLAEYEWSTMPLTTLAALCTRVPFAASGEDLRPVLAGVLLSLKEGQLTAVGTDGYCMSMFEATVDLPGEFNLIVPAPTLTALAGLLRQSKSEVAHLAALPTRLFARVPEVSLAGDVAATMQVMALTVIGTFPDYQQIIPKTHESCLTVDRTALLAGLKTACVLARTEANQVHVNGLEGQIQIQADTEVGNSQSEIDATLEGEPFRLMLNGKMLAEALGTGTDADVVAIEVTSPSRPVLVRAEPADGWTYVQMPMMDRSTRVGGAGGSEP